MKNANGTPTGRKPTRLIHEIFVASALSLLLSTALFFIQGCSPVERQARDIAAAAQGFIVAAQSKNQVTCQTNPRLGVCQTINQAAAAQNLLIDAIESYCGWPSRPSSAEMAAAMTCTPVKTAQGALQTALRNMNSIMSDLKTAAR